MRFACRRRLRTATLRVPLVVAFAASQLGKVRDWVGKVKMTVVGTVKRKAGMERRMVDTVHRSAASARKVRKS